MDRFWLLVGTIVVALTPAIDAHASSSPSESAISIMLDPVFLGGLLWTIVVLVILRRSSSPAIPSSSSRSTNALHPSLWLVMGMLLYLAPTIGSLLVLPFLEATDNGALSHRDAGLLTIGSYALGVCACVILACVVQRRDRRSGLELSVRGAGSGVIASLLLLPLLWFFSLVLLALVTLVSSWIDMPDPDSVAHSTLVTLIESPRDIWWWAIVGGALLGAPIVEEYLFRGAVQAGLLAAGMRPIGAILIASALFTLTHLSAIPISSWVVALPSLFLLSVVLGVLMERTGSVTAPIVMHSLFNLLNLGIALVGA
ncbi:MAG: CPBP family intramembrane glutamic endopeptidase [Phycisphaerales bacterium JB043]